MKNKVLLLFLTIVFQSSAQTITEEIASKKLNQNREISILTPASYEKNKNKKYPLLVLLDGEYLLDPFSGILSYTEYWNDLPEVIIVAINQNGDQERDNDTQTDENGVPVNGGDKFYEFIASELIPSIEKKYRISPFRIIAGHGLTAGFINFFLYKDKPAFNAYICMSPEMPEGMGDVVSDKLAQVKTPVYYYLATAEGDVPRLQKPIKAMNEQLAAIKNPAFRYEFDDFKKCSHYSLVVHAIPEALYHIFSSYQPISSTEYQQKITTLPSGYVEYLTQKYDGIEKDLGVTIPIRLNDFKAIEAAILQNNKYEELRDLARVASKSYPKTTLSDYYTALYYEKTGDTKKAVKAYQNSFNLSAIGEYTKEFMLERAERLKSE